MPVVVVVVVVEYCHILSHQIVIGIVGVEIVAIAIAIAIIIIHCCCCMILIVIVIFIVIVVIQCLCCYLIDFIHDRQQQVAIRWNNVIIRGYLLLISTCELQTANATCKAVHDFISIRL